MATLPALPCSPRSARLTGFFTIFLGSQSFWVCLSPVLCSLGSSLGRASAGGRGIHASAASGCLPCLLLLGWDFVCYQFIPIWQRTLVFCSASQSLSASPG